MSEIHHKMYSEGLYRPRDQRVIAGVFAGLGRRFGLDPWPARLVFTALLLVVPGSQLLIYPVLWVLMPNEQQGAATVHPPQYPGAGPTVSGDLA